MDLILWRHADAHDGAGDGDLARRLTAKGERQADRMGRWLDRRLPQSTRIVVSPAVRCQQTALSLGRPFDTLDALGPGAGAESVLTVARWPSAGEPVLVVGHQPTLGMAAALALTGTVRAWSVKKGAVWWLRHRPDDLENPVLLHAVQSPDAL